MDIDELNTSDEQDLSLRVKLDSRAISPKVLTYLTYLF